MQRVQGLQSNEYKDNSVLAAIDLGSNSFHLIITRIEHEELRPIERRREKVQLANGLKDGYLDDAAIERGLDCLRRFKQLIDNTQPDAIRIVGTNSLRAAKNAKQFNQKAHKILGQPIEVIGGREEARLVYLGVSHTLADDDDSRLVIDIGGGSTEFIIGKRFEPKHLESLYMGCVSYSDRFFTDGRISNKRYALAYRAATLELLNIRAQYTSKHWQDCIGSSGTFKAIEAIVLANAWSVEGISCEALSILRDTLLQYDSFDEIAIDGLKENRRNAIVAGVAIASAAFDALKIEHMRYSQGALREGVIYDLAGRLSHEDVRERSVNALVSRYAINADKANRVEQRCLTIFQAVKKVWGLTSTDRQQLSWAAKLHEIGLSIAHTQYHRHGEYLLSNSDLPGFSSIDQETVAGLVRCHRRKIPIDNVVEKLAEGQDHFLLLTVILRLAVLFKYVEFVEDLPDIKVTAKGQSLSLNLEPAWLAAHPLTEAELLDEQQYLKAVDFKLQLNTE